MKTLSALLTLALGLALVFGLLAAGYVGLKYVADAFGTLEPPLAALAAIASAVALLCAAIIAGALRASGRGGEEARAEKAAVYRRLLGLWVRCLQAPEAGGIAETETEGELAAAEQILALCGSPPVIAAHVELRRCARPAGGDADRLPALLAGLALEMRKDLGRKDAGVKANDLLELLLGSR